MTAVCVSVWVSQMGVSVPWKTHPAINTILSGMDVSMVMQHSTDYHFMAATSLQCHLFLGSKTTYFYWLVNDYVKAIDLNTVYELNLIAVLFQLFVFLQY